MREGDRLEKKKEGNYYFPFFVRGGGCDKHYCGRREEGKKRGKGRDILRYLLLNTEKKVDVFSSLGGGDWRPSISSTQGEERGREGTAPSSDPSPGGQLTGKRGEALCLSFLRRRGHREGQEAILIPHPSQ